MTICRLSLLFIAFIYGVWGCAQTTFYHSALEVGVQHGKIFKHTPLFLPKVTESSTLYELNLVRNSHGQQLWQRLHGYPIFGVRAVYADYGDAPVFGQGIALVPNLTFFTRTRLLNIRYGIGIGLAYLTQKYDRLYNPTNNVIGSNLNNCTALRLGLEWHLTPQLKLLTEGSFTHFSNGRTRAPNLGINVMALGGALCYQFNKTADTLTPKPILPINKSVRAGLRLAYGVQQGDQEGGPVFPIYIADLFVQKRTSTGWQIMAGIEANYYTGIYWFVINQVAFDADKAFAKAIKVSPYLGGEILLGHVGISLKIGGYAYNPFLQRQPMPSTLGIQYYMRPTYRVYKNQLFIGGYLRTHFANADYFGMGLGYVF